VKQGQTGLLYGSVAVPLSDTTVAPLKTKSIE